MACVRIGLLVLCFLICTPSLFADFWEIHPTVAGSDEVLYDVIETTDGGFLAVGELETPTGFSDPPTVAAGYLLKTDAAGQTQWTKEYPAVETFKSVLPTADGGFLVLGTTYFFSLMIPSPPPPGTGSDLVLMKVDANGDMVWEQTYGSDTAFEFAEKMIAAPDGGYYLAGSSHGLTGGNNVFYWLHVDATGVMSWENFYGGSGLDNLTDIALADNGDLYLAGHTASYGAGSKDGYLLRSTNTGIVLWQKTYGTAAYEIINGLTIAANGDLLMVGHVFNTANGNDDFYFVRTDADGNELASLSYGNSIGLDRWYTIEALSSGGYLLAGQAFNASGMSNDAIIAKIDEAGTVIWQQAFGAADSDCFYALRPSSYNGIIAVGNYASTEDAYLVHTNNVGTFIAGAQGELVVILEGPYDVATGAMSTALHSNGLIPNIQPYNTAPWNYMGTEQAPAAGLPANTVDWVLIEASQGTTVVQQHAAILLSDGRVVEPDGSPLTMSNINSQNNYRFVIRHRNHLDVISKNNLKLSASTPIDLTTTVNTVAGMNQLTEVTSGVYALRGGDTDGNGIVNMDDLWLIHGNLGATNLYLPGDANLDRVITVEDRNVFRKNMSTIGHNRIRYY